MAAKSKGGASKSRTSPQTLNRPIKVEVDKDSSVSVRQIENGFLVNESGTTGKGRNKQWYNKEFYSKTNPLKISTGGNGGGVKFGGRK